jgi:hypothetical protein
MHETALKYIVGESAGSGVVNGILNAAAAYFLFHGRGLVAVTGPTGLVRDSIGETFLVVCLSYMAAALISRKRRRAGTLPTLGGGQATSSSNIYVWSFAMGIAFTCVLVPLNSLLLPHLFPNGLTFTQVTLFKTIYGAILGAVATLLAVRRALNEVYPRAHSLVS